MARDPFEFDDFFTQDYYGTIQRVVFAENDFSTLQATFTNRFDEPQQGDDGEIRTDRPEFFNVGGAKDWQAVEHGSAFVHTSGDPDKRIRSNSQFGALVMRIVELVGKDEILARAGETGTVNPLYQSRTYEGLRFHWVTEGAGKPYKFKDRTTGEEKAGFTRGRQMPVEYDPSEQLSLVVAEFDVASIGLDDEMLHDLTVLAQGSSFSEFQRDGISFLKDLQDDPRRGRLVTAFSDTSFYETLRAT